MAQHIHTSSIAQHTYDDNTPQASQDFPGWYYEGTQDPYNMNELGLYSETQGSSGHQDPTRFGLYHGGTLKGFKYLEGLSSNQDPIRGVLQGFEHLTGLQSLDVE